MEEFESRPPWAYGGGCVVIDDLVQLSSNDGIVLWNWCDFTPFSQMKRWREVAAIISEHEGIDPARLLAALECAISYYGHELLADALSRGWPGGERGPIPLARFEEIIRADELRRINRRAKREHTVIRRREFQRTRSQLVLEMLESGIPYQCVHPNCAANVDLTIDHKLALSRGGGDEIANLQFMCRLHNSLKNDK